MDKGHLAPTRLDQLSIVAVYRTDYGDLFSAAPRIGTADVGACGAVVGGRCQYRADPNGICSSWGRLVLPGGAGLMGSLFALLFIWQTLAVMWIFARELQWPWWERGLIFAGTVMILAVWQAPWTRSRFGR